MGGSGGGSYFNSDVDSLKHKLKESENHTIDATYEANLNKYLSDLVSLFNDRNVEAINTHLSEIKKTLEKEISGTFDILYGGSVAKHTYVDGLSDIDSLVAINNTDLINASPDEVKNYFYDQLCKHFPNTEIINGNLAVTISFSDCEIQLLPAITMSGHLKISDGNGGWSKIRPKEFTDALSKVNNDNGGKVVPVVKLAKAIISNLPEKHKISGYHAESLAIEAFKNYSGELKFKSMLKHFFQFSAEKVNSPIKDRTGQSIHVDDTLGNAGTLERKIISDAFSRIYRRMSNADNATSLDGWETLIGGL